MSAMLSGSVCRFLCYLCLAFRHSAHAQYVHMVHSVCVALGALWYVPDLEHGDTVWINMELYFSCLFSLLLLVHLLLYRQHRLQPLQSTDFPLLSFYITGKPGNLEFET